MPELSTLGRNRKQMLLLSKASNKVQNIFHLYDVTGITGLWHLSPVATKGKASNVVQTQSILYGITRFTQKHATECKIHKQAWCNFVRVS